MVKKRFINITLIGLLILLLGGVITRPQAATPRPLASPLLLGYHESWSDLATNDARFTRLAKLPPSVNLVALSFARPDLSYDGDLITTQTGLEFPFDGRVLKDAIALLKQRNPRTAVILSVGGANYHGWDDYNPVAIARLVQDLGLDGVDLDYEPTTPACRLSRQKTIRCASDATWQQIVRDTRAVLPRPYLLSAAGWAVGAWGMDRWQGLGANSRYTGIMLNLLQSPEGKLLDLIGIMSYEAYPDYDALESFRAYRHYFTGHLALGVQVPPEVTEGSPPWTISRVKQAAAVTYADPRGSLYLYSLQKIPTAPVNPDNPDGTMLLRTICEASGQTDCQHVLP